MFEGWELIKRQRSCAERSCGSTFPVGCHSVRSTIAALSVTPLAAAQHRSRAHNAVIPVYDLAGNVIETHKYKDDFTE